MQISTIPFITGPAIQKLSFCYSQHSQDRHTNEWHGYDIWCGNNVFQTKYAQRLLLGIWWIVEEQLLQKSWQSVYPHCCILRKVMVQSHSRDRLRFFAVLPSSSLQMPRYYWNSAHDHYFQDLLNSLFISHPRLLCFIIWPINCHQCTVWKCCERLVTGKTICTWK